MAKAQVTALLDRPNPRSLGMLGLIIEENDGTLHTEGVRGRSRRSLDKDQVQDLIAGGHAVPVRELQVEREEELAALWVGSEFAADVDFHRLKLPPLPKQTTGKTVDGEFWVASAQNIWRVLDFWLICAFRSVVASRDERLASLMNWALPDRAETRAAIWLTATANTRDRDLEWWTKIENDKGRDPVTPDSLVIKFRELLQRAAVRPKDVVGFCAPAKGGDNEIAKLVANRTGVTRISFGDWLRERTQGDKKPLRPVLQQRGQEIMDRDGALTFCLNVLSRLPSHLPEKGFVIDGIRHIEVLESLRCLVGADRFTFAFVDRPSDVRRNLLINVEKLTPEIADQVMKDPTEREVPSLKEYAAIKLDAERGPELEGNRLLELLPI